LKIGRTNSPNNKDVSIGCCLLWVKTCSLSAKRDLVLTDRCWDRRYYSWDKLMILHICLFRIYLFVVNTCFIVYVSKCRVPILSTSNLQPWPSSRTITCVCIMYMYACEFVCIYMCIIVYKYVYVYMYFYVCINVFIYLSMYMCTYVWIYISIICVCSHALYT